MWKDGKHHKEQVCSFFLFDGIWQEEDDGKWRGRSWWDR